jgi:hypothetical protein
MHTSPISQVQFHEEKTGEKQGQLREKWAKRPEVWSRKLNMREEQMKLSEATARVIELAGKIRQYYATELPKHHPNYPVIRLTDVSAPPPREEKELRRFLATLPADMIYRLLLVMYIGRGDFGTDDLPGSYETLKNTFAKPEFAVSQMMDKAPLADYLSDGLNEFRKHRINVDKLPLENVKTRKR